jgi:hypothetical protein
MTSGDIPHVCLPYTLVRTLLLSGRLHRSTEDEDKKEDQPVVSPIWFQRTITRHESCGGEPADRARYRALALPFGSDFLNKSDVVVTVPTTPRQTSLRYPMLRTIASHRRELRPRPLMFLPTPLRTAFEEDLLTNAQ